MPILYAVITILAWGIWLIPSQNLKFGGQQVRIFYVAAANLVIAAAVMAVRGFEQLTPAIFGWPFLGGLVWALGGWAAFTATTELGVVRAYGIWAPLNIIVSLGFGALLFHEFAELTKGAIITLGAAVTLIIGGVLTIILSQRNQAVPSGLPASTRGFACAIAAGVLWAAYYLPVKISAASMWVAAFPLAGGMFVGCLAIVLGTRQNLRLANFPAYGRAVSSGVLWAMGNYGMLLMVDTLGAGKGYTLAQLALVVNALCGIFILKDPKPKTRAAYLALAGCSIATLGAIILGQIK
jgi:glucose uptake protein